MEQENLKRWRLVLGDDGADGTGMQLAGRDEMIDQALSALYGSGGKSMSQKEDSGSSRRGGLEKSSPRVVKWLNDIRSLFPQTVVQMMQADAIERLGITSLLTEREMLETVVPDVSLVSTLMSLNKAIPDKNKDAARALVRRVVDELMKKLQDPMRQAVTGALHKSIRRRNPRFKDINWPETIKRNLKNYQPDYKTIIPEVRIGYGRKGHSLKHVMLCIDQSGSMGPSLVYSSIFGAVMASIPAMSTRFVVFDTSVVDLTEELQDPVDILFNVQLGGGTDIAKVLGYAQQHVTYPNDTVLVVITDLYEGGDEKLMRQRFMELKASGVEVVVLLALSDDGASFYDKSNASFLAQCGIPAFACTPDVFPDLMAAVLNKQDMTMWVSENITQKQKQ